MTPSRTSPGSKIRTHSGELVDLACPDPATIKIEDIQYALSRIPRFTGHTDQSTILSVAQHSIVVGQLVAREPAACKRHPELPLYALLHDAHEAYLGDIATPAANVIGKERIAEVKTKVQDAIHAKVGLPPVGELHGSVREAVNAADSDAFLVEWCLFMGGDRRPIWQCLSLATIETIVQSYGSIIRPVLMTAGRAKFEFMNQFLDYYAQFRDAA